MSLYHQQRFAKLGYSASSILAVLPLLQSLLLETEKDSLLVQACLIYLEYEFFITELHTFPYLTYKVTLPLLSCEEVCEQTDLPTFFPKIYKDFCAADLNTLN